MIDTRDADFVAGLAALKEKYPHDHRRIDETHVVATLTDEEIHPLLIDLAGPGAPAYTDELTTLIQQFIHTRKHSELFGDHATGLTKLGKPTRLPHGQG